MLNMIYKDPDFKKNQIKKLLHKYRLNNVVKSVNNTNEKLNSKLLLSDSDYIIPDNLDILLSILQKNKIEEIYYLGQVINMCISCTRKVSINKILPHGFKCHIVEDLSLSFGYTGFDLEKKIFDDTITPESCHQEIKKYLEQFDIDFIDNKDI